jgi:putative membrane protein
MHIATRTLVGLVALEHLWFLVLEMFLFTRPIGLRTFKLERDFAERAAAMMKNQGLYNGFLAAGLLWSLVAPAPLQLPLQVFFLSCVAVAGLCGAATVSRSILWVQALPALVALGLAWAGR